MDRNNNVLDNAFQYLFENDFIYSDTYYDGTPAEQTMSYGEYAAVSDYMRSKVDDEVSSARRFEEAFECLRETVEGCGDDARMFAGLDDYEEFIDSIYEEDVETQDGEATIYKLSSGFDRNQIPECIRNQFEDYEETVAALEEEYAA